MLNTTQHNTTQHNTTQHNTTQHTICIIIPYFGTLPSYFGFWLKSISYNKNIDFLLITDDEMINSYKLPSNIKVKNETFEVLKNKIQDLFDFKVSLEKAYKLCDYRPIYGVLFKEQLKEYKYWGFCDIDLVFGDTKKYFNEIEFEKYERIFKRGHLSIFKNTDSVNNYFKDLTYSGKNFKEVFSEDGSFAFDETNGTAKLFLENNKPLYHKEIIADIKFDRKKLELTPANPLKNEKKQIFTWENGKVFRYYFKDDKINKNEFIYLHFQKRNLKDINVDLEKDKEFFITSEGFYKKEKEVSKEDFSKYSKNKGNLRFRIKFLLKKIYGKIVKK